MLNAITLKTRNLAEWLIAHETALGNPSDSEAQAAFRACEKLRHLLTKFAGVAGFQAFSPVL
jgi:hypothetical protein